MAQPDSVHNSGRSVAAARLLLALTLIVFSIVDFGSPRFEFQVDDIGSVVYAICAAVLLVVSTRSWWWDYRLFWPASVLDFLAFIVIPPHIASSAYGYFAGWTALATLVMVRTILFANLRASMLAFIALNVASYTTSLLGRFHAIFTIDMDVWDNMRQLLSLTFVTAFILSISERLRALPRLPGFAGELVQSDEQLAEHAAEFFGSQFDARAYMLCWQPGQPGKEAITVARGASVVSGTDPGPCCQDVATHGKLPVIFDHFGSRGLAIDADGRYYRMSEALRHDAAIVRSGFESGLSLPIDGHSGRGRLILSGFARLNLDALRYASGVPATLAGAFDSFAWQEVRKHAALADLRGAMARDLHDSVAQSLAGASFWLKATASRKDVGEAARGDILKAVDALDKENAEIRRVILDLRDAGPRHKRLCAEALREVLARFAQFWRVGISFGTDNESAVADSEFLIELTQLAREAISNAVRHGRATQIDVTLNRCQNGCEFAISDNGIGIDDNVTPHSLQQRVARLGGHLLARRTPSGTTVSMNFGSEHFQ